ncbi:hypothetical protein PILCRDRAFT_5119 [Piloderma croceum F 1598]|uniref:GED domain-containing protein n=1 Tax=Piloderma croceum (strain F 1598) TaxID=765440 RepID=A0A0C3C8L7_PILCF|nr:hypothetical protein PILCRDRAFT_5119 [Piloderma croceum F 1598]
MSIDDSGFSTPSSLLPSDEGDNVGVGLANPQLSQGRRRMLDLVNRLHSTGVQIDMDLPQIAVIGAQSAGKSSLIESISGITLPRAAGTCTRCPTECRLSYANEDWKCVISLRFITDARGQLLGQVRNDRFGPTIYDKAEVEERIRRAQRAILNPSTEARHFLQGDDEDPEERQLTFSNNCVSLQISGRDVADLSFVDLPGLIASVGKGGNANDIELVKNLVTSYIHKPSCLILSTVACETDFENQGAHHLAKLNDPDGKRTIGVLTKPDRIPPGEEDRWLRFIRNESEALQNGWYCVKQPNSKLLSEGVSWMEARTQENDYFSMTAPWSSLESIYQNHLRTSNLTERLSIILSELISKRLPEIHEELQNLLRKTETSIHQLPKPPSSDPFGEVMRLIGDFTSSLSRHVEGTPDEDGLLQSIRPAQLRFQRAIRETVPEFLPYERRHAANRSLPAAEFLANEEDSDEDEMDATNEKDTIYIDEVFERAQMARTRELPDNYPFVVQQAYISSIIAKWHDPALNLFDAVHRVLCDQVKQIIVEHFGDFGRGGLLQSVQLVMTEHIKQCGDRTKERISWLMNVERRPYTLNTHYYSDYRDKFLSFYRGCREMGDNGQVMKNLQSYKPHVANNFISPNPVQTNLAQILSSLPHIGITGTQATDLAKLFPPDPMEPALDIMAGVRAYFQVAYKRFSDIVPMAIDHEFVSGVERDIQSALLKGLGLSGKDGFQIARQLVQEPHNVSARREELKKKLDRLNTARNELLHVGL